MEATSRNPRDAEGGKSAPGDITSMIFSSDSEDTDEDVEFYVATDEIEDSSSDSGSDEGDRDQPSTSRLVGGSCPAFGENYLISNNFLLRGHNMLKNTSLYSE